MPERFDTCYVLTLACPDKRGIVAAVSGFILEQDGNILASSQYDDTFTQTFFMRMAFAPGPDSPTLEHLKAAFAAIGKRFQMNWEICDPSTPHKVLVMVSKIDHCLYDLLYRQSTGALNMEIPAIVSNHPDLERLADFYDIPFHYLPVTAKTKAEQEAKLHDLVTETGADLIVLARYMQILSDDFCAKMPGRIINIHHSFLPSFKGAKPYHQAHARGVKLIGATAHYVTAELDEGPIIEQDAVRVTHAHPPAELIAMGRDVENVVLARAVKAHLERRVLMNGAKTVVFR